VDGPLEVLERLLIEAELRHVELQVRLVEEPHDDLLAPDRGQDGDAEVHLLALAELQLDAAVLREPALGDVELAHDLDAARDGVLQLERRLHLLDEHAVDAVADAELLLVGLDVDVAGALLDRVERIAFTRRTTGASSAAFSSSRTLTSVFVDRDLDLVLVELGHDLVVVEGRRGRRRSIDGRGSASRRRRRARRCSP
jgi:hypothetical protein